MSFLRQIFTQIYTKNVVVASATPLLTRNFHCLTRTETRETKLNSDERFGATNLLNPLNVTLVPTCGFKIQGKLKRRCKDCYFVRREERLYVICKTHPRHKQMQVAKPEKMTWILSHATQGKFRSW